MLRVDLAATMVLFAYCCFMSKAVSGDNNFGALVCAASMPRMWYVQLWEFAINLSN